MSDNYPQVAKAHIWTFFMRQTADGYTGITGLTPTVTVSQDGGAFATATGAPAPTEIAVGWYKITIPASDFAETVILQATGAGARPTFERIVPGGDWLTRLVGRVLDDGEAFTSQFMKPNGTTVQFTMTRANVSTNQYALNPS